MDQLIQNRLKKDGCVHNPVEDRALLNALTSAMKTLPHEDRVQSSCLKVIRHILPLHSNSNTRQPSSTTMTPRTLGSKSSSWSPTSLSSFNSSNIDMTDFHPPPITSSSSSASSSSSGSHVHSEDCKFTNYQDDLDALLLDVGGVVELIALIVRAMECCPKSYPVQFYAIHILSDLLLFGSNHELTTATTTTTTSSQQAHQILDPMIGNAMINAGTLIRLSETLTYHRNHLTLIRTAMELHATLVSFSLSTAVQNTKCGRSLSSSSSPQTTTCNDRNDNHHHSRIMSSISTLTLDTELETFDCIPPTTEEG